MDLSVIMPVYNNSLHITQSIKSILNQTLTDFEFIIIDDCSSDDTVNIIKTFKDPRIKLFVNLVNIGLGNNLNRGLSYASSNTIAIMHGDDIALPDRLTEQYKFFKNNNFDVVGSFYGVIYKDKLAYLVKTLTEHSDLRKRLALHSELICPSIIANRTSLIRHGRFNNVYLEDYEFWLRVKDVLIFGVIPKILLLKRVHGTAKSNDIILCNKESYLHQDKYYTNLLVEFGIENEVFYRAWREFFYGSKIKARKYFLSFGVKLFLYPKSLFAMLLTYLSHNQLLAIKDLRVKFRVLYYLSYYSKEKIALRNILLYYTLKNK